jgi:hypothetical protein
MRSLVLLLALHLVGRLGDAIAACSELHVVKFTEQNG